MRPLTLWVKIFTFATALAPLIVGPFALYPFGFGKMIFVRSAAALVAGLAAAYGVLLLRSRSWRLSFAWFRNPLILAVLVFLASAALSTALSSNPYRGFFGDVERGEGLLGLISYGVIFVVAASLFTRENWKTYFELGLLVALLIILHTILQYFRLDPLPFTVGSSRQPGSIMGNPALLSSFLILMLGYAGIVYRELGRAWKYAALGIGIAALGMLGVLAVRGALLGIALGALLFLIGVALGKGTAGFQWRHFSLSGRTLAVGILAVLFLLGGLLYVTRMSPLWQSIPALNRVAAFSLQGASVKTRTVALGVSLEAFKERPLLGWGLEQYGVAYNTYYNPAYAIYAEEWFDRAHNKILDVAVMQGVFGILSYLGIFLALGYVLWRTRGLRHIRLFLLAVMVAYVVQNLFIFDHINSYLPFFAILAFCAFEYARSSIQEKERPAVLPPVHRTLLSGGAAVLGIFVLYSLYAWEIVPVLQARQFVKTFKDGERNEATMSNAPRFLEPYNFFQKDVRMNFAQLTPSPPALQALEEVATREPENLRLIVRLAETYHKLGDFEKSKEYIERARILSPRRQAIRGLHSFILSGAGRHAEAIVLARETLALESNAAKSHYYLGMVLALALSGPEAGGAEDGKDAKEEAIRELRIARELGARNNYVLFFESDFRNMMVALQNLGAPQDLLATYKIALQFYPQNLDYYRILLVAARRERDAGEMIRIAERIKELHPVETDDMDTIIDLARRGKWEILDNL